MLATSRVVPREISKSISPSPTRPDHPPTHTTQGVCPRHGVKGHSARKTLRTPRSQKPTARHGSHICSPVPSFPPGAHRCFSAGPTGVYRGGRAPTMKVGGHRELGTGEHMWDPCRGGLAHLSQHFWKKVLEGDAWTWSRRGLPGVPEEPACFARVRGRSP